MATQYSTFTSSLTLLHKGISVHHVVTCRRSHARAGPRVLIVSRGKRRVKKQHLPQRISEHKYDQPAAAVDFHSRYTSQLSNCPILTTSGGVTTDAWRADGGCCSVRGQRWRVSSEVSCCIPTAYKRKNNAIFLPPPLSLHLCRSSWGQRWMFLRVHSDRMAWVLLSFNINFDNNT